MRNQAKTDFHFTGWVFACGVRQRHRSHAGLCAKSKFTAKSRAKGPCKSAQVVAFETTALTAQARNSPRIKALATTLEIYIT